MLAMIAAVAANRVIGRKGKIPWDIAEDREHFKRLTLGKNIVMGRRTYEEIGHPLPGRMTYLVSSALRVETENCHTVSSLAEAVAAVGAADLFVCGGASLYEEALLEAQVLYITELSYPVEGDTCFPPVEETEFEEISRRTAEDGSYSFVEYHRIFSSQNMEKS